MIIEKINEELAGQVTIEDCSFDYEYGSIMGCHHQLEAYLEDGEITILIDDLDDLEAEECGAIEAPEDLGEFKFKATLIGFTQNKFGRYAVTYDCEVI